jgi:hypothetical protein
MVARAILWSREDRRETERSVSTYSTIATPLLGAWGRGDAFALTIQQEGSGAPSAQTLARMVSLVPGVTSRRIQ